MVEISRTITFDSAHRLIRKEWSDEKNKKVYGKCFNLHGHTYKLIVNVKGEVSESGMLINFKNLKEILNNEVIERYDHKFLNECSDFKDIPTTVENMAVVIFKRLKNKFKHIGLNITLSKLTLYETMNSYAIVKEEGN